MKKKKKKGGAKRTPENIIRDHNERGGKYIIINKEVSHPGYQKVSVKHFFFFVCVWEKKKEKEVVKV